MSAEGIRKKKARAAQGFELNPPRCLNCEHFKPPNYGVPGKTKMTHFKPIVIPPRKPYIPPTCAIGDFEVKTSSICDKWLGREGEVLE